MSGRPDGSAADGAGERVHDVVVVGGGVAGLVAAWELRDRDVLVLEAGARVGGRLYSLPRDPYWLNLGAHLFPPGDSVVGRIAAQLGLAPAPFKGTPYAVAMGDKIIPASAAPLYPLRMPLPLAGRASLVRAGLKLVLAEARANRARRRAGQADVAESRTRALSFMGDVSFADWIGEERLHPQVAELFGAVAGRLTATTGAVSAGCLVTHYAGANKGSKSVWHTGMPGGSSRFPETLAGALGTRVRTGAAVERVTVEGELVRVRTAAGETVTARHAILATTAGTAARLAPDLAPDTRAALEQIPYGPYVVVSLLTNEQRPMPWDELYAVLVVGRCFNIFMNQGNMLREPGPAHLRQPGGSVMLYAGGDLARPFLEQDDAQVARRFLADAERVFPDLRGIVAETVVQRWPEGVPFIGPGRHRLQPALERTHPRLSLAGDYFGYPSMEESAISAVDAARQARAALARGGEPSLATGT